MPGIGIVEKVYDNQVSMRRVIKDFRDVCSSVMVADIIIGGNPEPYHIAELFTVRESQVLKTLIREEGDFQAVADALGISDSTVKTHMHNIYQKTGTSSKGQLMAQYIKNPERFGGTTYKQEAS